MFLSMMVQNARGRANIFAPGTFKGLFNVIIVRFSTGIGFIITVPTMEEYTHGWMERQRDMKVKIVV